MNFIAASWPPLGPNVRTAPKQLSDAEQASSGVKKDMVRVSVGIEDIADIIADFQQALDATKK
jgi:O-acetylhomoserine/O-acetylserine sulfhydrylase-like pyridoxal-dependent enzyme